MYGADLAPLHARHGMVARNAADPGASTALLGVRFFPSHTSLPASWSGGKTHALPCLAMPACGPCPSLAHIFRVLPFQAGKTDKETFFFPPSLTTSYLSHLSTRA